MKDLDPNLRSEIDKMFQVARSHFNNADHSSAIKLGEQAWARLPEPKFEWDVSKSYVHALAFLYRDTKNFEKGIVLMQDLFNSKTVLKYQDGPYFVLGTIYYEAGDFENAKLWLKEADRISKGRTFRDEPEKYKNLINK